MKHVIIPKIAAPLVVLTPDVSHHQYYGVQMKRGGRGFISSTEFDGNTFTIMCPRNITISNRWDNCDAQTLQMCVERIIVDGFGDVYEFDTPVELFKWVLDL